MKFFLTFIIFIFISFVVEASDYDLPNDIEMDTTSEVKVNDRFENFNRRVFEFNKGLDTVVVNPATKVYGKITFSEWGHERISHALQNLHEPTHMVNSILYGNPAGFFRSGLRFMINTVFGFGGLFDTATRLGIQKYDIKFSDVMAGKMCIKNGPYLMMPLLGPFTTRNVFGLGMDEIVLDPLNYVLPFYTLVIRFGVEIISVRYEKRDILQQINTLSVDEYAMMRSLYYQSNAAKEFTTYDDSKK